MRRGELTNQPAPVVAVDWRILATVEPVWGGLKRKIMLNEGAKGWIERNWYVRMCVVMIGNKRLRPKVREVVLGVVAEFEWFECFFELRLYLKRNPQIVTMFTSDFSLLSLDGTVRMFSGWNEVIHHGL
jgi:hypothetical protein